MQLVLAAIHDMFGRLGIVLQRVERVVLLALLLTLAETEPVAAGVTELEYHNMVLEKAGLPPQTQAEFDSQRAYFKKWETEYEGQRLRGAGFRPANEIQQEGRTVIRLTYSEPRLFIRMPGVTLEPQADGSATVTLSSDGRAKSGSARIPGQSWLELKQQEAAVFAPDPPPPPPPHLTWNKGDPIPDVPPVCHAWGTEIERISPARHEKVSAHGCNQGPHIRARLDFAVEVAEQVLKAFPECATEAAESDPLWQLGQCFGKFDPATTENP